MKSLIEAGAKVDAGNEWKLSPLGVSILKGHKGISDYLMTLPDIEINMKDDDGKTILMNMFVNQDRFTVEFHNDVKNLVENHKADPCFRDNKGKIYCIT